MRSNRMMWRVQVVALSLFVGLWGFAQDARAQAADVEAAVCEIQLDQTAVPVQAEAVTLSAKLPAEIGERLSARLDEGSGVQVVTVQPTMAQDGEGPAVRAVALTLNTANAIAGEWALTLEDEDGRQCTAKVRVQTTDGSGR